MFPVDVLDPRSKDELALLTNDALRYQAERDMGKTFAAPMGATTGLAGYDLEGQKKKKKKRGPKYLVHKLHPVLTPLRNKLPTQAKADLAQLLKRKAGHKAKHPNRTIVSNVEGAMDLQHARLAARLAQVLRGQGERIATAVAARVRLPKPQPKLVRMMLPGLYKAAADQDEEIDRILDSIDLEGFGVSVSDEITDDVVQAFEDAGIKALRAAGIETDDTITELVNDRAVDFARERGAELVGKQWEAGELVDNPDAEWAITDATREDLASMIAQATQEGMTVEELREMIIDSGTFSEARADMIARTELATAHVQGNIDGWRESGVVSKKRWLVADSEACDICEPMRGEEVDVDDEFSSGDDGPPLHPNCRCDVVGVVEGDEEDQGDTNAD